MGERIEEGKRGLNLNTKENTGELPLNYNVDNTVFEHTIGYKSVFCFFFLLLSSYLSYSISREDKWTLSNTITV